MTNLLKTRLSRLPTLGALSYAHANLLPSPKRIRIPETAMDLEDYPEDRFEPYVHREVRLGVDFKDESSELSRSRGADLVIDVDVVLKVLTRESETDTRGLVEVRVERVTHLVMPEDTSKPAQDSFMGDYGLWAISGSSVGMGRDRGAVVTVAGNSLPGAVKVTYETLGDLVQRIFGAESAVTVLTARVVELERDNMRLRGTASVES
ncbi:hypothetical protein Tco_1547951 [Tanacetum coccineum]